MTELARRVVSADGVGLAVHESGWRDGPVVVAVHGYPDNHHVWDGMAARLGGHETTLGIPSRTDRPSSDRGLPPKDSSCKCIHKSICKSICKPLRVPS